ncbi:MAG: hypothetical protein NT031_12870 [Planctomycetota bacterium]|nr:hypothetical protein [Planctomycetota bacterium]
MGARRATASVVGIYPVWAGMATLICVSFAGVMMPETAKANNLTPTATVVDTLNRLIDNNGDKATGRLVELKLTAVPRDLDYCGDDGDTTNDSFALEGAHDGPYGVSTIQVRFTTMNATVTTKMVKLKIKDDGVYYQDFTELTEVNSLGIAIVDPDGLKVEPNGDPTSAYGAPIIVAQNVRFRLMYGSTCLPWCGSDLQVQWGPMDGPQQDLNQPGFAPVSNPTGTWGNFSLTENGASTTLSSGGFRSDGPSQGKYDVCSMEMKFRLTLTGNPPIGNVEGIVLFTAKPGTTTIIGSGFFTGDR